MATAQFKFQRLLPSSEKVARVEFHPELPLLASIDRRSYLTIWDYARGEPLFECQFGENSLYNKDTLDAIARAEANPDHFGRPLHPYMQANYLTPSVYGKLKNVSFLDIDTVCWTIAVQRVLQQGPAARLPALAQVAGLAEQRRVILTCEKAIVLLDIISKRVATIPSTHYNMGGRAFSMALALPRDQDGSAAEHVRVAIASVDGTLRVVNGFNPDSVVAGFATKKDVPISAMAVVPIWNRDAIIAGDEKGHLFVFDPSDGQATAPLNKDGTRAPSASLAAFHKDTVHSICFAPGPDPSNPNPRLITASACNRIGVWDVNADKHSWGHAQLLHKVKTKDITITGACALLSGVYMAGMTGALLSTNTAEIYGVALDTNTTHPVIDMASNLPARDAKKGAKLYAIASPLLHPEVCAAATNAGIAILRTDLQPTHAVCGLTKLASFSSPVVGEGGDLLGVGDGAGGEGEAAPPEVENRSASVVIVAGNKLIGSSYTTPELEFNGTDEVDESRAGAAGKSVPARLQAPGLSQPLMVQVSERSTIADLGTTAFAPPVAATCSASGARVAVCSQKSGEYAIFYKPDGRPWRNSSTKERTEHLWPRIDAGNATQVAWHFRHDVVALLAGTTANAGPSHDTGKSEGGFFSRKKASREQEFQRQAAAVARSAAKSGGKTSSSKFVTIRNVSTTTFGSATTVVQRLEIPNGAGEPTAVHGGLLLGVSVTRGGEKDIEKLLVYDWNGGLLTAGSELLPAPNSISYSPSAEYAALLYRDAVEIYSLHNSFSLLTRISVHVPLDALWLDNTLFTSSPSDISAHFIIPPAPKGQQLTSQTSLFAHTGSDGLPELSRLPTASAYEVQSLVLATNRIGIARPLSNAITQPELPPMPLRPGMLWKLVRVTQDTLWMVSTAGHAWAMSLMHAGLKCRIMATQGDLQGARKLAASALHYRFHDNLARMFCALGSLGAAEGLLLPGLSLELELALAIKCGALRRGYACLAALLAGCTDRVLLSRFAAWSGRDKDPDAPDVPLGGDDADPFAKGTADEATGLPVGNTKVATDVIAVFKQAAGANADQILKRIADYGVQGRKTALDADMFTSPDIPEAPPTPSGAGAAPPPSSEKYKPMFPRGPKPALPAVDEDGAAAEVIEEYEDVIDWDWPLRPPPPVEGKAPDEGDGDAGAADEPKGGEASPTKSQMSSPTKSGVAPANGADGPDPSTDPDGGRAAAAAKVDTPLKTAAAIPQAILELGLRLLDASVLYADTETLQSTIQLMAPHTSKLTQSQQARLVAAVGAAGAATQLSDLTLKGTASLLPSAAMLAGFLAGDARVAARVLEMQGFVPLQAMFCQSCGAGGVEASVQWESQLRLRMGGPTRELTITPQTT